MLSSLSNFLFNAVGSPLEDVTNMRNNGTNTEYQTQDVDDDWLLVDRLGCESELELSNPSDTTSETDSSDFNPLAIVPATQTQTQLPPAPRKMKPAKSKARSRKIKNPALKLRVNPSCSSPGSESTPPSSPNQQMDGSWYVTPPPCFTASTGPIALETSPMENLLIEHPSMSVYGPIQGYSLLQASGCSEFSGSDDVLEPWIPSTPIRFASIERAIMVVEDGNKKDGEDWMRARVHIVVTRRVKQQHQQPRVLTCAALDSALEEQRLLTRSKLNRQQFEQRKLKPSYMERQNQIRQYQSNNKRQRNCSHLKQPAKYFGNRC